MALVWGAATQVSIEWLGRCRRVDESDGVVPQQRGRIALLHKLLIIAKPVDDTFGLVREIIDFADERPVLVVETALPRPILLIGVAEVPLADNRRGVASLLQRLW